MVSTEPGAGSGKKLLLVDGSALLYRSYYAFARNPLRNSKGESTGASFGVLNTIVTLEAIIITTLVLIRQRRLGDEAQHRRDLDLQMGLLTEHELTRVLQMLDAIQRKLGIMPDPDGALADLEMETRPEDVLAELVRLENRSLCGRMPTL